MLPVPNDTLPKTPSPTMTSVVTPTACLSFIPSVIHTWPSTSYARLLLVIDTGLVFSNFSAAMYDVAASTAFRQSLTATITSSESEKILDDHATILLELRRRLLQNITDKLVRIDFSVTFSADTNNFAVANNILETTQTDLVAALESGAYATTLASMAANTSLSNANVEVNESLSLVKMATISVHGMTLQPTALPTPFPTVLPTDAPATPKVSLRVILRMLSYREAAAATIGVLVLFLTISCLTCRRCRLRRRRDEKYVDETPSVLRKAYCCACTLRLKFRRPWCPVSPRVVPLYIEKSVQRFYDAITEKERHFNKQDYPQRIASERRIVQRGGL